jgi:hypothetical protein
MFSLCNLAPFPIKLPKEKYTFTQILIGKQWLGTCFPQGAWLHFPKENNHTCATWSQLAYKTEKKGLGVMFSLRAWLHLLRATSKEIVMP